MEGKMKEFKEFEELQEFKKAKRRTLSAGEH
jgi:hypothetical protein